LWASQLPATDADKSMQHSVHTPLNGFDRASSGDHVGKTVAKTACLRFDLKLLFFFPLADGFRLMIDCFLRRL
jgi:hypothetical protein